MNASDAGQRVFVDTLRPETADGKGGGFFRQSWGAQLVELQRKAKGGDETRIHFTGQNGTIPSAGELEALGIRLFVGVGHETTGATTYTAGDIANLLEWLAGDRENRHAVLDATSMLGAMPWGQVVVRRVMRECCLFMPFQKAISGISGYFVASFTLEALALVEQNGKDPCFAIPPRLKIVAPVEAARCRGDLRQQLHAAGGGRLALMPLRGSSRTRRVGVNTPAG